MPFKSQAQRAFMHMKHPDIADRWEKETPAGSLPDKGKTKKPKKEHSPDEMNMDSYFSKLSKFGESKWK